MFHVMLPSVESSLSDEICFYNLQSCVNEIFNVQHLVMDQEMREIEVGVQENILNLNIEIMYFTYLGDFI